MKKTEQPRKGQSKKRGTPARPLDPEEYRRILEGIQLRDISLEECAAKVHRDKLAGPLAVEVKWEAAYNEAFQDGTDIRVEYELLCKTDDLIALSISCTFRVIYSSGNPLPKEFIEIFAQRNSTLNTWPYFRELTQSMVQKMNLPPLVLPLLKLGSRS